MSSMKWHIIAIVTYFLKCQHQLSCSEGTSQYSKYLLSKQEAIIDVMKLCGGDMITVQWAD